jgi:hypothetical protein
LSGSVRVGEYLDHSIDITVVRWAGQQLVVDHSRTEEPTTLFLQEWRDRPFGASL